MKGKKDIKEKIPNQKKIGRPIREVVPPANKPSRENNPVRIPESFVREYHCEVEPYELFPEWPSEEEVNVYKTFEQNFDFGLEKTTKFVDHFNYNLPGSIISEGYNEIKWLSPEQYIKEHYLDEKLKKNNPNKNIIKLRNQVKLYYEKSKSLLLHSQSLDLHSGYLCMIF